jgi:ribose transport system ATP-binding protein
MSVESPVDRGVHVAVGNLSKTFPGTRALKEVDLDVRGGEIHALCGGNGSGKSTLIKILTGVYQGDPGAGAIQMGDTRIEPSAMTPELATQSSIHAVHQDLGIFPDLSVLENLALGFGYRSTAGVQINWRSHKARARQLLDRFEIDASPGDRLGDLSQSTQTQVAIARALQGEDEEGGRGLLILDEPTSSLPAREVEVLLDNLRRFAAQGQAILYVSHRLDEVLSLADRVTVLRDGAKVGTYESEDLDEDELIRLIVGQEIERVFPEMPDVEEIEPLLEVRDLWAGPLRGVNLTVRPKEVLGIAGLLGSGRTELLRAIFGDLPIQSGNVLLDGEALRIRRPADAMELGIAHIPENRALDAAFHDLPLWANISMANVSDYWKAGFINSRRMKDDAAVAMEEFSVKATNESALLSTLSGGNQQKVIVARWLRRKPRLMLLDEPTQGVDVGARAEIYGSIKRAVEDGAAAIVVASDLDELAHVCDRVIALRGGRVVAEMSRTDLTAERLTQAAYEREANQ